MNMIAVVVLLLAFTAFIPDAGFDKDIERVFYDASKQGKVFIQTLATTNIPCVMEYRHINFLSFFNKQISQVYPYNSSLRLGFHKNARSQMSKWEK